MSIFSTLNAEDLMAATRKNLQPMIDAAEDKGLASLHAESIAWQSVIDARLKDLNATLAMMFDGYVLETQIVGNRIVNQLSKKETTTT